ncbi:MAG: Kiwa anti-phage protein KwaB-like domain-containing protein [Ktedonobacteraceae bacterium]
MSTSVTATYTDVFDEILTLDLSKCVITVCLASVVKDEVPRFARLQITDELAIVFRDTIKNLIELYKQDDCRQLCLFPEYNEDSLPADYHIQRLDLSKYQTILEQLGPLKALTSIDSYDANDRFISALRFYVIAVQPLSEEPIYFFRTYTHKKLLNRSLIYAIFQHDWYDLVTDAVLVFDSKVDCLCRGDAMFIFDKKGFQNIFCFFDEVRQIAKGALESIKVCIPIKNFDEFTNDCGRHIWKQRMLKNIASKSYLSKITIDHIKKVIDHNKLPVQIVNEDGKEKLVYDPKNKWVILNLLDDNYLWSMLTEIKYEVTGKQELS